MTLCQQTNRSLRPINHDGEQIRNIPPKHADIEGLFVGYPQVSATQKNFSILVVTQANLGLDCYGGHHASDTTNETIGFHRR